MPILDEILFLKTTFDYLTFCHIYKERNMEANYLSKKGLQQVLDSWYITDLDNGWVTVFDRAPYL